jgi:hypothetical protein
MPANTLTRYKGPPQTAYSGQRRDRHIDHFIHPQLNLHRQSRRLLRHHFAAHCRTFAVLHVLHRLHSVATNLSPEHIAANSILARPIWSSSQYCSGDLLRLGVLLVVLAYAHTCYCCRIQLGFSYICGRAHLRYDLLCHQCAQGVPWTCDTRAKGMMEDRTCWRRGISIPIEIYQN